MGYAPQIPANQLGKSKTIWLMREYGLYPVCVRRESTVADGGFVRLHTHDRTGSAAQYELYVN